MNKNILARLGITEYHYEDPNGAYPYNVTNEYNTDGEIFVLGAKKDSMYIDKATWLLISEKKERILYTEIKSEDVLKEILGKFIKLTEDDSDNSAEDSKKKEARHNAISRKLNSIKGKRVLCIEDLIKFIKAYRAFIEGNAGTIISSTDEMESFIDKGCTIYIEEYDDRADLYLLSVSGDKLLVMEGGF